MHRHQELTSGTDTNLKGTVAPSVNAGIGLGAGQCSEHKEVCLVTKNRTNIWSSKGLWKEGQGPEMMFLSRI